MSSAPMEVDVGVVTYNTAALTVEALRRLLDTDQGCRLRLLVHDNGSADGTVAALAREVPEAEVVAGDHNLGFAAGMNAAIERSRAPWFLALNSDAWPEPGAIGALVAAGEDHPEAAAVAPRLVRPDGSLEYSTHPFPSVRVAATLAVAGSRWPSAARGERMLLDGYWRHDRPREVDWAVGAALLMRRQAIDHVGGFDERFFMYAEDLEWCHRARAHGWRVRFEPGAVVVHVGNASGAARYGRRRTGAYLANTYRFYRDVHGPASAAAWRLANLAGCARQYTRARRRHDPDQAAAWADQVRGHLRRVPRHDGPPPPVA